MQTCLDAGKFESIFLLGKLPIPIPVDPTQPPKTDPVNPTQPPKLDPVDPGASPKPKPTDLPPVTGDGNGADSTDNDRSTNQGGGTNNALTGPGPVQPNPRGETIPPKTEVGGDAGVPTANQQAASNETEPTNDGQQLEGGIDRSTKPADPEEKDEKDEVKDKNDEVKNDKEVKKGEEGDDKAEAEGKPTAAP